MRQQGGHFLQEETGDRTKIKRLNVLVAATGYWAEFSITIKTRIGKRHGRGKKSNRQAVFAYID